MQIKQKGVVLMNHRLKADYSHIKDFEFVVIGRAIIAGMSADPVFAGPVPGYMPSIKKVKTAIDKLEDACNAASPDDESTVAARIAARREAELLLVTVGQFYETAAPPDPQHLDNAGYDPSRETIIYRTLQAN